MSFNIGYNNYLKKIKLFSHLYYNRHQLKWLIKHPSKTPKPKLVIYQMEELFKTI